MLSSGQRERRNHALRQRARHSRRRRPHHGDAGLPRRASRGQVPRPHHRRQPVPAPRRLSQPPRRGRARAGRDVRRAADHAGQELGGARLVAPAGPAALDRPAGLLQPAHVHHGALNFSNVLESGRTTTSPTPRRAPTTGSWSSSARSTGACCRPATCRCSISSAPRQAAREAIELGAKALLIPSRCPRRPLARATSASIRCGRWPQEAGLPIVFHVGGGGTLLDPGYFNERPAAGEGLPRRRRQLHVGRLHGDPAIRRCRRSPR